MPVLTAVMHFPAVNTLAEDTGLSESTVRRKLQELEELELVNRGNQAIAAAHIERADRRPIVYDLHSNGCHRATP